MKAHKSRAVVLRAKAVFHQPIPDFSCGAILRDLFEEVIVGVEEEAEARSEVVDIKTAAARPFDVLDTVIDGESQFLKCGRTSFADVISGNGNRIEARSEDGPKLERIDHQSHRRRGR